MVVITGVTMCENRRGRVESKTIVGDVLLPRMWKTGGSSINVQFVHITLGAVTAYTFVTRSTRAWERTKIVVFTLALTKY